MNQLACHTETYSITSPHKTKFSQDCNQGTNSKVCQTETKEIPPKQKQKNTIQSVRYTKDN
jgi:hypothetical protein